MVAFAIALVILIQWKPHKAYCETRIQPSRIQINDVLPSENFLQLSPTLRNDELDFSNESQTSCCAHDYTADGKTLPSSPTAALVTGTAMDSILLSQFQRDNLQHSDVSISSVPVSCKAMESLPILASNGQGNIKAVQSLPIEAFSTNVSSRAGAVFLTDISKHKTSDFHLETSGGSSHIALKDVEHYSVCMARGQNELVISNTSDASIMAYAGDDHIVLAGNNTNMFTRTGPGQDKIEIHQGQILKSGEWKGNTIYKTAISGGSGADTLVLTQTPPGTKWCHVGLYRLNGELFHVVEFALPPTVTEGTRRQRISIGSSIETVQFRGKTYLLNDFLSHGEAQTVVAENPTLRH